MAKKHYYRRHQSGIKKLIKKTSNAGASLLIAGPVLVPVYDGFKYGVMQGTGGLSNNVNPVHEAVYSAIGYNMATNSLDTAKLSQVAMRDAAMVAGGLVLRWASKRV